MDEHSLIAAGYTVDEQSAGRTKASAMIIILMVIAGASLGAALVASLAERRDLSLVGVAVFLGSAVLTIILQPRLARCSACGKKMTRRALPPDDTSVANGILETRVFICEPCRYFFVHDRLHAERTVDAERDEHRRAKRQQRTAHREAKQRRKV